MIYALSLLILLFASPSWAAVSHDATSTSTQNNISVGSGYTHTRGGTCPNAIAIASVNFQDSTPGTISGVTYNGSAMTAICTVSGCANNALDAGGGNKIFASLWYYKNPPSGASAVVPTFSESMNSVTIATSTYCGVDQTTPIGTAVTATQGLSAPSVTVTSAVGELVVDTVAGPDRTYTVDASQTQRSNFQDVGNHEHVSSEEAGASSVVMSWSLNSNGSTGSIGVPLKPAAATVATGLLLLGVGQ